MIYCPQCGNPNFDDANYCDTCGEPLVNAEEYAKMQNAAQMRAVLEAQRQQREAEVYNKAYRKAHKEAKKAAKAKGGNAQSQAKQASAGPYAGDAAGAAANGPTGGGFAEAAAAGAAAGVAAAGAPGDFTMYKHGCLAQAWDDITETRGWAPKIIGLGLVNMVPVLNFFVSGFSMKWAAQLPADKVEPMPEKIFADGAFVQGFYAFVLSLVLGVVTGVAAGLIGLVPILGVIVGLAISLFMTMFQSLAIMRIAIYKRLGQGFNVKAVWQVFAGSGKNGGFGKLFCATLLPGIIVGAAAAFLCGSVLIIFGLNSLNALIDSLNTALNYDQQMQMYSNSLFGNTLTDPFLDPFSGMMGDMYSMLSAAYDPWADFTNRLMGMIPLFFVLYLIAEFMMALANVLTLRATAHYIVRYAPAF